jgi:hypothetical protein
LSFDDPPSLVSGQRWGWVNQSASQSPSHSLHTQWLSQSVTKPNVWYQISP